MKSLYDLDFYLRIEDSVSAIVLDNLINYGLMPGANEIEFQLNTNVLTVIYNRTITVYKYQKWNERCFILESNITRRNNKFDYHVDSFLRESPKVRPYTVALTQSKLHMEQEIKPDWLYISMKYVNRSPQNREGIVVIRPDEGLQHESESETTFLSTCLNGKLFQVDRYRGIYLS